MVRGTLSRLGSGIRSDATTTWHTHLTPPRGIGVPFRHGHDVIPALDSGYLQHREGPLQRPAAKEACVNTKEKVREVLDRLPDDCDMDDVLYQLYVVQQIDRGLADVEAGRTIPHDEVAEQFRRKWVLGAAG